MRWIEPKARPRTVPPSVTARLLRAAVERGVATPAQREELARALFWSGDYAGCGAQARAKGWCGGDPRRLGGAWPVLAYPQETRSLRRRHHRPGDRAEAAGANIGWMRGALRDLGRESPTPSSRGQGATRPRPRASPHCPNCPCCSLADQAMDTTFSTPATPVPPDMTHSACRSRLSRHRAPPPRPRRRRTGRSRSSRPARTAGDPAPLREHRRLQRRALADEILCPAVAGSPVRDGLDINYEPFVSTAPAFTALHAAIRDAMERYIASMPARGLDKVMPPPPEDATFFSANVVLTRDGRNGEHIHGLGYVSAVYHVARPVCGHAGQRYARRSRLASARHTPAATSPVGACATSSPNPAG